MKVLRSSFVAAVAIFAAACGDKVNIVQPSTTVTSAVTMVAVAPGTATMSIGQTVSFTAVVTATGTAATTVTWNSTDATKVSVSAAGVATAVAATPGVAICATSTVNTSAKGCASVAVTSAATTVPASVSIASITGAGGLNAPVNPLNVAGQIDVRLNVNPGTQTVSKIVVVIGTVRADSQTFTAAQAASLRFIADEAVANQSTFPQIVFSINTAGFTQSATTGAITTRWTNGAQAVSVQLFTSGSTTAATATAQTSLTFNNIDTYVATLATSGTAANALNAGGFRYDRGGLAITVAPIAYSGGVVAAGTVSFGSAACDGSVTGVRTTALVAPVAPSALWTAAFAATGAAAVGNVNGYEFTNAAPCAANALGETIAVTATNGAGDALLAAAAPANAAGAFGGIAALVSLRLDNRAPLVPTLVQNPNLRQNGWVNTNIALTSNNTSATSNGSMIAPAVQAGSAACVAAAAVDCGVGSVTRWARVAASATGTVAEAIAATASTTPTLPAPSLTNTTYCSVHSVQDALGNESALPAAATACSPVAVAASFALAAVHQLLGVDIAAPTIAFSAGLGASGRLSGGAVGAEFQVTVSDTGIVGNSGMLSTSAVRGTVQIRQPAAATTCTVGVVVAGVCTAASVNAAPAFPLVPTTVVAALTTVGYYFYSGFSQDAAGNQSAAITRVTAYDPAANVPTLTTALFNVPISGGSVTFNANASDNFELRDIRYTLTYAGGLAGPLAYPATTLSTYPTASAGPAGVTGFVNSNVPVPVTIANFVRQIQDVTANGPIVVSGAYKPTGLNGILRDVVNINPAGSPIVTAIPGASVTTGVSYLAAAAPLLANSWAIVNAATLVSQGTGTPVNALSVTLNADLFGPTATFNSPFARVDFYVLIGGSLEQIGTQTTFSTVDDGSAMGRRHRYSFAWTPGTTSPVTGTAWGVSPFTTVYPVYAVGVNAVGDALVTIVNGAISITAP